MPEESKRMKHTLHCSKLAKISSDKVMKCKYIFILHRDSRTII